MNIPKKTSQVIKSEILGSLQRMDCKKLLCMRDYAQINCTTQKKYGPRKSQNFFTFLENYPAAYPPPPPPPNSIPWWPCQNWVFELNRSFSLGESLPHKRLSLIIFKQKAMILEMSIIWFVDRLLDFSQWRINRKTVNSAHLLSQIVNFEITISRKDRSR